MASALDRNQLPEFLQVDDGGFVHLRGSRIGLHHVFRRYQDGASPEMLASEFPSLSLLQIHKLIVLYLEHTADAEAYMREHDAEMQRQMATAPKGPTLDELTRRLALRSPAQAS